MNIYMSYKLKLSSDEFDLISGVSNEPNIGFGFTQGDAAVSPGPSELQQREYATNFDVAQAGNSANQGDTDPLWLMTNYGKP